ncbi:hypothetical protein RIF29_11853 [Crotalaria pallida]|uniref:Uncharacterized protein n=1 Tax=Crotalaria pallida TaxID=3830 RepID=A0AAN9IMK5_CROPI
MQKSTSGATKKETNDKEEYGPWMIVQKSRRRRPNNSKNGVGNGAQSSKHETESQAPKMQEVSAAQLSSHGTRFDVLADHKVEAIQVKGKSSGVQPNFQGRNVNGPNRSQKGPNYQSRDAKAKQIKKSSGNKDPRSVITKENVKGNTPMQVDTVMQAGSSSDVAILTPEENEKKKKFEQLCLDIMRKKQEESWNQFKEGKYDYDLLGAVGVYNSIMEKEFLKKYAARFKNDSGDSGGDTSMNDSSVVVGMENVVPDVRAMGPTDC